jgi:hypothetical protein
MIEEAMSITPVVLLLVILLFGFDLTEHARDLAGTTITAYNKAISLLLRISRAHRIYRKREMQAARGY